MRPAYYRQRDGIVKSVPGLIRRCHRSARICMMAVKTAKPDGQASFSRWRTPGMATPSRYLEAPRRLRAFVRAHETSLVVLAAVIGTIGGVGVVGMSGAGAAAAQPAFTQYPTGGGFRPSGTRTNEADARPQTRRVL